VLGRHRWPSSLGQGHETRRPGAAELPAKGQSRRPCNKRSAVVSRSPLGHAAFGVHSYTRRSVPPKRKLPRPVDSLELDFRQRRIDEGKRRAGMTGRAIPLGRIAGIPVRLDSSWFLIFALVRWTLAAGYYPAEFKGWPAWEYWETRRRLSCSSSACSYTS